MDIDRYRDDWWLDTMGGLGEKIDVKIEEKKNSNRTFLRIVAGWHILQSWRRRLEAHRLAGIRRPLKASGSNRPTSTLLEQCNSSLYVSVLPSPSFFDQKHTSKKEANKTLISPREMKLLLLLIKALDMSVSTVHWKVVLYCHLVGARGKRKRMLRTNKLVLILYTFHWTVYLLRFGIRYRNVA